MADMYNTTRSSSSSPPEPDDFSLFLQQILLRSSSTPSLMAQKTPMLSASPSVTLPANHYCPIQSSLPPRLERQVTDQISVAESSSGLKSSCGGVFSSSGGYFLANVPNVSSSSVGTIDNDAEEYDCESEGFDTLVEEGPPQAVPPRNGSKRSRAAEVHNLSEKRRRSRINEKMKALQNLIPNSNKTDKASMLDEAIEYLKQLQLQVQMLTMRNGLSLYPMCLPEELQPAQFALMKMGPYEGNGLPNMSMSGTLPVNQDTRTNNLLNIPNQSTNEAQPPLASLPNTVNSKTSLAMGSSIQSHLRPFQLHTSSEEIYKDDMFPCQELNVNLSERELLEFQMGAKATASNSDDRQPSGIKDNTLDACILGTERPESLLLSNLESEPIVAHLNGRHMGRRLPESELKTERLNF